TAPTGSPSPPRRRSPPEPRPRPPARAPGRLGRSVVRGPGRAAAVGAAAAVDARRLGALGLLGVRLHQPRPGAVELPPLPGAAHRALLRQAVLADERAERPRVAAVDPAQELVDALRVERVLVGVVVLVARLGQ